MFTSLDNTGSECDLYSLARRVKRDRNAAQRLLEGRTFCCKFCDRRTFAILGRRRVWHFRHEPNGECSYVSGDKESHDHLFVKHVVCQRALRTFPGAVVSFEKRIEVGDRFRVADVAVEYKGVTCVYEIQLSPLDVDELERRTIDYDDLGFEIRWVFQEWKDERSTPQWQRVAESWLQRNCFDVYFVKPIPVSELKLLETFTESVF